MKELFSIGVCLVAGLSFSFLSQQEALAFPNQASASFSSSSYETFDGTDLGISFQYPYNWVKFEAGSGQGVLNDFEGVVSFDIVNDTDDDHLKQGNDVPTGDSGLVNPNLSVVSLRSPYHNLTLRQYAEIRTFDFIQLFSDYDLRVTENGQSNGSIDGYPYWVFNYSFTIDEKTQRYGTSLWLIRGEKIYEISYIADSYEDFIENLGEIRKIIKSVHFVDHVNQ
jgi:hypothetical protein